MTLKIKLVLRYPIRKMSLDDDEVSLGRAGQCLGMKFKSIRNTSSEALEN